MQWKHFLSLCHLLLFGTETRGQHRQKVDSLNLYGIESVDNHADELKIKFWACCNNVNWTAQKYFIQTCRLPLVQGDTEGFFIPSGFHEHFHQCWEQFCPNTRKCSNTRRELCTINMTGTFTIWLVICCVWTTASRTTIANLSYILMKVAHESYLQGCVWTILNVWTSKELDALLGTRVVMWVLHFNPVELWICCKLAKLAGSISKARAGQSACCLSSDRLESSLKLENMWEQLKSGK